MSCDGMASPFFPPSFLLQMQTPHQDGGLNSAASVSPLLPAAAAAACAKAQDFYGDGAELRGVVLGKRSAPLSGLPEACEDVVNYGEEDLLQLSDDCSGAGGGERKRRLNVEQVRTLELNFEMGNKLEPERKMQLARALRLQPRQVAIWFQNRRARWKTKQLERDYEELRRRADALREENDALHAQNKALEAEISALRGRRRRRRRRREAAEPINLNKETEGSCSNRSDNSSDINLDICGSAPAAAQGRPLFRPVRSPASAEVLLPHQLHRPKLEHGAVPDEGFCNMFPGLDDQAAGFCWGWSEQHSFL